jgi:REP element-mobilizing transposase RayT
MPNHFHTILEIIPVGATLVVAPNTNNKGQSIGQPRGIAPTIAAGITPTIAPTGIPTIASTGKTVGDIVGAFKSMTTNEYIRGVKNNNWQRFNKKLWQRNYWEHIIRNENEYNQISQYIIDNPLKWENDKLNMGNTK